MVELAARQVDGVFVAPLDLTYPYSRTSGPVLTRFLQGLSEGRIEGVRLSDGTVHVPPLEFDPATGGPCDEWVALAATGTVRSWSWQPRPGPHEPLSEPFAWALIQLDGADSAMLHAVDARSPDAIATGSRVVVRWADEPRGAIDDIRCFELLEGDAAAGERSAGMGDRGDEAQHDEPRRVRQPISITYDYSVGPGSTDYLSGLTEGRLIGRRCPACELVYFPPRQGTCPRDGVSLGENVDVGPAGTITTFCVVNVPFLGQTIEIPYVAATVLLDGADIGFQHLIQECDAHDVRSGMRVEPVWRPRDEWGPTLESIAHFRPVGDGGGVDV